MNTPTPITDAHKGLWTKLFNLAHDEIFDDFAQSDGPAHQLIADSEARAVEPWRTQVEELRGALALGQENCDDVFDDLREERDQLRAEVERCNDIINRASVQFFHDGTDGETAAKMLKVLNEAKP